MKKIFVLLMVGVLVLLTGCSAKNSTQVKKDISGKTTISWWAFPVFAQQSSSDGLGTYEKSLIAAFEKKHPDIHVELNMLNFTSGPEKIRVALANGTMGDVLLDAPGRIIAYGKAGKLIKLNDLFTEKFCQDVHNDTLLGACKDKTTDYMYPLSSAPFYMVFNKAYLEDAGVLELVREGWTTKDFVQVMAALRQKGYVAGTVFCRDAGGDQATRAFAANLYNGSILDEKLTHYTIQEEKGLKGLKAIGEFVDKGYLLNGTMRNGSEDIANFATGRTSMSLLWSPGLHESQRGALEANHITTVEVPLPAENGTPSLEYLVNGFCVFNNNSKKKVEASKLFIQFLCDDPVYGPQNVVRTGSFPVRTSFGALYKDTRMQKIGSWAKYYGTYYNTVNGFGQMRKNWSVLLQRIQNKDMTVQEAAEQFAAKSNLSLGGK